MEDINKYYRLDERGQYLINDFDLWTKEGLKQMVEETRDTYDIHINKAFESGVWDEVEEIDQRQMAMLMRIKFHEDEEQGNYDKLPSWWMIRKDLYEIQNNG